MHKTATTKRTVTLFIAFATFLVALHFGFAPGAFAQWNAGTQSLRTPLLPGAPAAPPYTAPQEGQAPPIGDGFAPSGINPGMMGWGPDLPASHVPGIPPVPAGPAGKSMVNGYVAPYLTPPPQHPAADPGMIDSPPQFYPPPVNVTNINPSGGIFGSAPIDRWGGQTTRDYGAGGRGGSSCVDGGERLVQKPNLKMMPQSCQDGPRPNVASE
ncbi:MAG: hypothetical protein K8F91_22140 [Candidatus Obscuribacterales bacterium]|nr:hypothetical protein [Candidatus Obscuribacterales bacterium]